MKSKLEHEFIEVIFYESMFVLSISKVHNMFDNFYTL